MPQTLILDQLTPHSKESLVGGKGPPPPPCCAPHGAPHGSDHATGWVGNLETTPQIHGLTNYVYALLSLIIMHTTHNERKKKEVEMFFKYSITALHSLLSKSGLYEETLLSFPGLRRKSDTRAQGKGLICHQDSRMFSSPLSRRKGSTKKP